MVKEMIETNKERIKGIVEIGVAERLRISNIKTIHLRKRLDKAITVLLENKPYLFMNFQKGRIIKELVNELS